MKNILLVLASSFLASFASADPVTIDPDGLAEGTNISNAYSGVTLRHIGVVNGASGPSFLVDDVYVKECLTTSDPQTECPMLGTGHFGYQTSTGAIAGSFSAESSASISCIKNDNPNPCRWHPHDFLDATFDSAVQEVTIDGTHRSDYPWAWAFDAAGNQLQINQQITWHKQYGPGYPNAFGHQTLTITPVSGQISRVIFAAVGGFVRLDKLTYTAVP